MNNLFLTLKATSKFQYSVYIFITAFIFRIFIVNFVNTETICQDGTGYLSIAHNYSEGLGYSLNKGEKYFFREPGYPIFLSGSFYILKVFGFKIEHFSYDLDKAPEITLAKYLQAILDSLTCVLFFLLIAGILNRKFALIIAIIFSLYYPYAYTVTNISRETLQTFLAISMTYSLMLYFENKKITNLILTGFFWGLLNLTFQATLIFGLTIPIFIWIYQKKFVNAIIPSLIIVATMLLTVSPWLIRSYQTYPDFRVLRSFGTSLTPEYISYIGTVKKATYYGLITNNQEDFIDVNDFLSIPEARKFEVSWDGTLIRKTDSINSLINEPVISKRRIIYVATNLKNCTPQTFAGPIFKENPALAAILILPIALLCMLSFWGFVKFFPKFFKINIFFITYISVFLIVATEKRRMYPIQPFILLYGMMAIIYLYYRYFKRYDNKSFNEFIFLSNNY
ncbi:MAG: glycosyltransferase family 39 protein [Bacteroidia bacterium]|nr:glycosyltransferase family 39 protein [Bacteroidia bacterium]